MTAKTKEARKGKDKGKTTAAARTLIDAEAHDAEKFKLETFETAGGMRCKKSMGICKQRGKAVNAEHILVKLGKTIFNDDKKDIHFVDDPDANAQLNDLDNYPHLFVLACCMDRQITAEKAWMIPRRIGLKIGGFDIGLFAKIPLSKYKAVFASESLHRFNDTMACVFYQAVQRIMREYGGNAAKIWLDKPGSAELVLRFLSFEGVGVKIATMAANILARQFKVPVADYYSIDVSPDVHVKRVMDRMGLVPHNPDSTTVIYVARNLCPEFPGIIDSPLWRIGREYCDSQSPKCTHCPVRKSCATGRQ